MLWPSQNFLLYKFNAHIKIAQLNYPRLFKSMDFVRCIMRMEFGEDTVNIVS